MLTFKTVSLHFVMFGPFHFLGRIVHIPTTEFGKLLFIMEKRYERDQPDRSHVLTSSKLTCILYPH